MHNNPKECHIMVVNRSIILTAIAFVVCLFLIIGCSSEKIISNDSSSIPISADENRSSRDIIMNEPYGSDRPMRHGFIEENNSIERINGYQFSVPCYYVPTEIKDDHYFASAEGEAVYLKVAEMDTGVVSPDELNNPSKKELEKTIKKITGDDFNSFSMKPISTKNYNGYYYHYLLHVDDAVATCDGIIFKSDFTNFVIIFYMMQPDYSAYQYYDDYSSILNSIEYTGEPGSSFPSEVLPKSVEADLLVYTDDSSIISDYNVRLIVNGEERSIYDYNATYFYVDNWKTGKNTIRFESENNSSVFGEITLDVYGDTSYILELTNWPGSIDVGLVREKPLPDYEDYVRVSFNGGDEPGIAKDEALQILKEVGFTNIEETGEGDYVESISIDGIKDYMFEDRFLPDAPVIVYCTKESATTIDSTESIDTAVQQSDSTSNESVFHSSGDLDTAKKGNTGTYAYKSIGGTYTNYIIVEFGEDRDNFVYLFSVGNGNDYYEKLRIQKGTLADKVLITYHDNGDTWNNYLFFKSGDPTHLILKDNDGFEYDRYATDLQEAIKLKEGLREELY